MDRIFKSLLITVLISLASICIVLWFTEGTDDLRYLAEVDPLYIILAMAFHAGSWVLWSARMKILTRATGGEISFLKSFQILLSSLFAAGITPSEVGGEPVKIFLLSEEAKGDMSLGDATAVVVTERFLDVIFLVLISPLGIIIFRGHVLSSGLIVIPIIAVAFFVTVFSILILIMYRPDVIKVIMNRIFEVILRVWKSERMKRLLKRIDEELGSFIKGMWIIAKNKYELVLASGCTVARWLMDLCVAPLILIGLGSAPNMVHSFAAQILLIVLLLVPITPGGSGIAEISSAAIFSTFVKDIPMVPFVFLFRFVTFYFNLILGAVISVIILKDIKLLRRLLE